MGVDVGSRKTGIAVGQAITKTAKPISIIQCPMQELHAQVFADVVKQWHIDAIVIGLPGHQDGSKHPMTNAILRLVKECEEFFSLPVFLINEYLTSHEAKLRLPKSASVDAMAAAVIAEDWLAENCQ